MPDDKYTNLHTDGDELEWEDVDDSSATPPPNTYNATLQSPTSASTARRRRVAPYSPRNTPRRTRPPPTHPSAQVTSGPELPPHPTMSSEPKHHDQASHANSNINITSEEITRTLYNASVPVLLFAADILGRGFRMMRYPLSLLVFALLFSWVLGYFGNAFSTTLAPLCYIPILSTSLLAPLCPAPPPPSSSYRGGGGPRPDYPALVEMQNSAFDKLLDDTSGGSALALEIKKSEMATADLATLVRVSKLTSKELLADTLIQFVEEAKITSRSLQKLSSKVGGAVDTIMAVNDHALKSIAAAYAAQPSKYSLMALLPGSPSPKKTNEIISSSFNSAMETSARHLNRLLLEAHTSHASLDKLEEKLGTLHAMIVLEDQEWKGERDELLALLWTKLGGNKRALRDAEEHLRLLRDVGGYRKKALAHVVGATQTLTRMSEDMEDLRERVASPELAGDLIPVEVHMKSIQNGLERLREGRSKSREVEEKVVREVSDYD